MQRGEIAGGPRIGHREDAPAALGLAAPLERGESAQDEALAGEGRHRLGEAQLPESGGAGSELPEEGDGERHFRRFPEESIDEWHRRHGLHEEL